MRGVRYLYKVFSSIDYYDSRKGLEGQEEESEDDNDSKGLQYQ